ncbi:MAG: orotidine-5'-phosphate decarboxylase [Candidatus Omnitrophota bacterium]|jgi:orotidine-5'-phosphate decarboxylase
MNNNKLIVALDVDTFEEARILVDNLGDMVSTYKVGSQLFTAFGPMVLRHLEALGKKVFLDLKWYDIPNTVANAVTAAVGVSEKLHDVLDENENKVEVDRGLFMCTVHTQGGEEMLKRAVGAATEKAEAIGVKRPMIVGITVLTSAPKEDNISAIVLQRAQLAKQAGLDGVVASSQEAAMLRTEFGKDFIIVTPGIRPTGADVGDQKRVTTPKDAIDNGSSYLVVGRPIVKAADPARAAENILKEINNA